MSRRRPTPAEEEDSPSDTEENLPPLPEELANLVPEPEPEDAEEAESFFKEACEILESEEFKELDEEDDEDWVDDREELYDFPPDPENWKEEDLKEYWADGPPLLVKPGFDPNWVEEDELKMINDEIKKGNDPPIAPFYVPYRKPYPVVPNNHYDIRGPKSVIEELDRIEEFLTWHSFVFADGSTYEGTVWDDLAHGKGVFEAEQGLVRYEGEWLQNNPEGHGVLEVDIPTYEPVPGSELEAKMRAEGHIFKRDFMSPEDKEWLEKDIEDCVRFSRGRREIPFYENEEWVRQFGQKPEKGRYRYAGQWKHARMHGCGVFELNERTTYGRFYFGEFMEEEHGCDVENSALHAGIAEVAAAKARMFVNKPDGMVREERGPYSDPQHPYLYEGEDLWMAPGFINQLCEVPDYWKAYIEDVDEERQMWINSFYKAPLRLPMPAELEYWWQNEGPPEFILLNKEPEPDPEDPSQKIYTEDPLILHTPTGRIINYIDDEEYGIRMFWQPPLKEGEDVDPSKVEFLPIGNEELLKVDRRSFLERVLTSVHDKCNSMLENLEKETEEKKKENDLRLKIIETDIEIAEAESELKEIIKEMDDELKRLEIEEQKKAELGLEDEDEDEDETAKKSEESEKVSSDDDDEDEVVVAEDEEDEVEDEKDEKDEAEDEKDEVEEEEEEEEEEDDDENTPSSFGSVVKDEGSTKGKKGGRSSPFASSSLPFASCGLASLVPSHVHQLFVAWKESKLQTKPAACSSPLFGSCETSRKSSSVGFKRMLDQDSTLTLTLRARNQVNNKHITGSSRIKPPRRHLQRNMMQKPQTFTWPNEDLGILSLHIPI